MNRTASLIGKGKILDFLTGLERTRDFSILAMDTLDWDILFDYQHQCRNAGQPFVSVVLDLAGIMVGPFVDPVLPGCLQCLNRRMQTNAIGPRPTLPECTILAIPPTLAILGELLNDREFEIGEFLMINALTLECSHHRFLPHPDCECCFPQCRVDHPFRLTVNSDPSGEYRGLRVLNPKIELQNLITQYVDPVSGLVPRIHRWYEGQELAYSTAEIALPYREIGVGRTDKPLESDQIAVLEALERYSAVRPPTHVIIDSVRNLGISALDPTELILHAPHQYCEPAVHLAEYSPDNVYRWVWGWTIDKNEEVLVPEQVAYYGVRTPDRFLYEISNGCAIGGSIEEAILHGLLEVIERDAFLTTWYGRLPVYRVDVRGSNLGTANRGLIQKIESRGYDVSIFYLDHDTGIPAFWVMATSRRDELPRTHSAAAAHPDAQRGIRNALFELVTMLPSAEFAAKNSVARAAVMVADSTMVQAMSDHSLLYSHPDAYPRLRFLMDAPEIDVQGIAQVAWPQRDVGKMLQSVVQRIASLGYHIVIIDETQPEHTVVNLSSVKVLVPGFLPMTFGHQYRRVYQSTRLETLIRTRGGFFDPVYPHPFP